METSNEDLIQFESVTSTNPNLRYHPRFNILQRKFRISYLHQVTSNLERRLSKESLQRITTMINVNSKDLGNIEVAYQEIDGSLVIETIDNNTIIISDDAFEHLFLVYTEGRRFTKDQITEYIKENY